MVSEYKSLTDWRKADPYAAAAAKKQGLLPEICKMFGWEETKNKLNSFDSSFTKTECLNDALKFTCKGMWRLKSLIYYNASKRNGWFEECTAHMAKDTWDFDSCLAEAKLYKNNWSSKSPNSYTWASKYGYRDEINSLISRKNNIKTEVRKNIDSLTKKDCLLHGLKYKFKVDWYKNDRVSYLIAKKNGWLDECTAHMPFVKIKKVKYKYWTKEKCLEAALTCESRSEFMDKYQGAYIASKKNGWYEECTAHMFKKEVKTWTKEKCLEAALTCESRSEFMKKYPGAYLASRRNGWYEECTAHMDVYMGITKEKCLEVALTCDFKYEWEKKCRKTYNFAKRNGWFEECTAHMVNKNITKECCISSALNFNNRWPWEKNNRTIVTVAKNNGWYEECIAHMGKYDAKPANFWDLDAVIESTKGYDSFSKWLKANRGAYNTSRRNGWIDKVKSCFGNVKSFTNVKYDKITCIEKAREYTNYFKFTRTLTGVYLAAKENGWLDECCQHMENYKNKVV
jgi:hypothetical protein